MNAQPNSRPSRTIAVVVGCAIAALALGGCQSPMYSGVPDDAMSASIAPSYSPGTYEPPAKVGRAYDDEESEPEPAPTAHVDERQYEYRGGRDPITGRAKTQL